MTKRERAAHAAKWREVARYFEDKVGFDGELVGATSQRPLGLCAAAPSMEDCFRAARTFRPDHDGAFFWDLTREGDDCRVISAGLIAAMYETGEFDD